MYFLFFIILGRKICVSLGFVNVFKGGRLFTVYLLFILGVGYIGF